MTATAVQKGDFSGWSQVFDHPGHVMAWNWPPMLSVDFAKEATFLAVAIGLADPNRSLAIRTPPWVPNTLVAPLISLVMREQAAGVPIAISLSLDHDAWAPEPGMMALMLHSTDWDRLNGYLAEMSGAIGASA